MLPIDNIANYYHIQVTTPTEASTGSELSKFDDTIDIVVLPASAINNRIPSPKIWQCTNTIVMVFIVLLLIAFIVHIVIRFFRIPN